MTDPREMFRNKIQAITNDSTLSPAQKHAAAGKAAREEALRLKNEGMTAVEVARYMNIPENLIRKVFVSDE